MRSLTYDIDSSGRGKTSEPNDTISGAKKIRLKTGGIVDMSGTIGDNPSVNPGEDVDFYSVKLKAGQTMTVDIDANAIGSSLDSFISVFDAFGNRVAYNDDCFDYKRGGYSVDSYLEYTASAKGTYYIGVSSCGNSNYDPVTGAGVAEGNSAGSYQLLVMDGTPIYPS